VARDTLKSFGDLRLGVLAPVLHVEQQLSLRGRQLGLLTLQVSFGSGDRHPFSRAHADQVALELGHHREHVEQQPPYRISGVVPAATEAECDTLRRQFVSNLTRVPHRTREPIELGDDEGVAFPDGRERLAQSWSGAVEPVSP
jgi:hypothetical protein